MSVLARASRSSSARAEQRLILLSAGTAARRRELGERAVEAARRVDWSQLAGVLSARKLLTVLGPRMLELPALSADAGFADAVERALVAARRRGAFLQMISAHVRGALAGAGIRSAGLKGPFLAEDIYGDPGRRISGDIDLLVAAEQLHEAVAVARGLGYELASTYVEASGLPPLHFVLVHATQELPPLELHWRVHWYERDFSRQRLLPPDVAGQERWRPAPADELVALLLFYARDGFIDLRLATDLSAWWDRHGSEVSAAAVAGLLGEYPELARVVPAALAVAERVVGLPASSLLAEMPALGLRQRLAARLANPNPRSSRSQLYADMGLVDGLLAPPGGAGAFVRRQLLPPPEVLDEQARHGEKRQARSRVGRCTGVLARYGWRMARLVAGST
ncbi:MAG TPA: nucleotidyltransferase family protein [Solirubrobacteraceae bacterium]|nr:nucleotidyltransferase family protein [Solirubrobacteraceae bacterium]